MTTYLVIQRLTAADGNHFPGDVLVDPDNADILLGRGFLSPVPEDYKPPKGQTKPVPELVEEEPTTSEGKPPTIEQSLEAGYSREAASILLKGETSGLVNKETALIEKAMKKRPKAIALAKAVDSSLSEVMDLSDEEYEEAAKAMTASNPGTVGAAEDKG